MLGTISNPPSTISDTSPRSSISASTAASSPSLSCPSPTIKSSPFTNKSLLPTHSGSQSFSHRQRPTAINIEEVRRHSSPVTSPTKDMKKEIKPSSNYESQIPTPKKSSQKRKTRVSDLISRLSSSTASSRAKAEAAKAAIANNSSARQSPNPSTPSHSTFTSVFRSSSGRKSLPNQPLINPITSIPKWVHNTNLATVSNGTREILNSPNTTLSPTPNLSDLNTSPSNSIPAANRRHSAEPRPISTAQAIQQHRNSTTSSRRVSYNAENLSNPPTNPPPAPTTRERERSYLRTPSASRSSSVEPRKVRRPNSRASMGPPLSRMQSNRVEELKYKISELEEVLQQERLERQTAEDFVEQIKLLEQLVNKEKQDKETLALRVRLLETATTSTPNDIIPTSPNISLSETETLNDEDKSKYVAKINELEAKLSSDLEGQQKQNVVLETEISLLKADNQSLNREKENCQAALKNQEEYQKTLQAKCKKLETIIDNLKQKIDSQQLEIVEYKGKHQGNEKIISNKDSLLREKSDEIDELKTRLREEKTIAQEAVDSVELVKAERDELQRQVQGFQASRRVAERTMAQLEKENRRAKRLNIALEASLQDLKISLEEKAMENDELNRSIVKVMEQANETIEGAKRHSLLMAAPSIRSTSP